MKKFKEMNEKCLNESALEKIKQIAHIRYRKELYDEYYSKLESIRDLSATNDLQKVHVVLGDDWVILYETDENILEIIDWISARKDYLKSTAEMLSAFKKIFKDNREKVISASLREDTSLPIYESLLLHGYLEELYDDGSFEEVDGSKIHLKSFIATDKFIKK